MIYSTFLGGDSSDSGRAVAVDATYNAYLGGVTSSSNFPIVNAFQSTGAANFSSDCFVSRLNAAGSALVYSTYLGGTQIDECQAIALDPAGNAYLTGITRSTD